MDKISVELQNVFITILKYQLVKEGVEEEGGEHEQFLKASRSQDKLLQQDKYAKYRSARSINPFPKGDPTGKKPVKKYGKRNPQYRSKLEEIRAKNAEETSKDK